MSKDVIYIEPGMSSKGYWKDIWYFRDLFYILSWRDISVRYKQTVLGVIWALIRPILTTIVFTFVFGKVAKLPSQGLPYTVFVFAATLPWGFFSTSFTESSNSLIGNANLISKVYFPRLIIPISSVIVAFVDFLITFCILVTFMLYYDITFSIYLLLIPVFLLISFFFALGLGMWLAALNVRYRDFRYLVPLIAQFGLYISPVGFASSVVESRWQWIYYLNPMAGVIDGFRWAVSSGQTPFSLISLFMGLGTTFFVLVIGYGVFRKMEKTFADII